MEQGPGLPLKAAELSDYDGLVERLMTSSVLRAQLLRLAVRGCSATEAARVLKCHPQTAMKIYADPDFRKAAIRKLDRAFGLTDEDFAVEKRSLILRLQEKAENAFSLLCDLLESNDTQPALRVKIAQDFLDRNPETQPGYTVQHKRFEPEQLMQAARAAREMDNVIPIRKKA